jgi:hypothetical protein
MDCVAHRGPRHVYFRGRACQPPVHRVRLPPHRALSRVDSARGLVGSGLRWESGAAGFRAQPGPGL